MSLLTFKNLDSDIERCCTKMVDKRSGIQVYRGYFKARKVVFDAYIEKELYREVIDYLLDQNWQWGVNEFFEKAIRALEGAKAFDLLRRLWRGVIASQTQNYWAIHTLEKTDPDVKRSLLKAREISLDHMSRYRDTLQLMGDIKEIDRLDKEIKLIENGEPRSRRVKPDSRKIDENLFWQLIENAYNTSDSMAEQMEVLISELERFNASEIKNFQSLLDAKICEAYRWDIWALAYISQDGCSDDGFVDFRAWLILQGRETFEAALRDFREILNLIPSGQGNQVEGLQSLVAIAYLRKTGKTLSPKVVPPCKLKGLAWEEGELEILFPEVCAYFNFKT